MVGQGDGPDGTMDEARDQAGELEAAVEAPGEAGEIAAGMVGVDAAVEPTPDLIPYALT